MLKLGSRVVCVDVNWRTGAREGEIMPVLGSIYTIRGFYESRTGVLGLCFEEIVNPPLRQGDEVAFLTSHFRPVRDTDISVFQSMLLSKPKELV